jgi:hypothetical protein
MKVWLHFTNLLVKERTELESRSMEIADVQLSLSKQPKHKLLFQLADIQEKLDDWLKWKDQNQLNAYQKYRYDKETKVL